MAHAPDVLLLPVRPAFIWVSLAIALLVNLVPLGPMPARPDILALTLAFWAVHQPRRVGLGAAFVLGLVMDVHAGALLGQHALGYTLMMFAALVIQRRLLWYSAGSQALQILPVLVLSHAAGWLARAVAGDGWPDAWVWVAPLIEAVLWPLASWVLLAPQRRPPDPDENRPL